MSGCSGALVIVGVVIGSIPVCVSSEVVLGFLFECRLGVSLLRLVPRRSVLERFGVLGVGVVSVVLVLVVWHQPLQVARVRRSEKEEKEKGKNLCKRSGEDVIPGPSVGNLYVRRALVELR